MRLAVQLAVLAAAFAAPPSSAMSVPAANLGTAMAFGQIAFVLALVAILVRG